MRARRRRAFTLVEALATTALAALLALAGFRVIASVGRGRAAMTAGDPMAGRATSASVLELLRWDLANARFVRAGDNELSLYGFNALDADTLAAVHRPVAVVYRLRSAGGRPWLVRDQTDLDVLSNRNRWTQLVCPDVTAIRLERLPSVPREGNGVPTAPLRSDPRDAAVGEGGWAGPAVGLTRPRWHVPLPDAVRLTVRGQERSPLWIDEVVYCR